MTLGPFAFEGIGFGFDGLTRKIDTSWSEIEVAQRMNAQQWLGPTNEEVTIKGVLFPAQYGGLGSLNGIMEMAKAGEPMILVSGFSGMGTIHGFFTVQSVDEDRSYIDARGVPRKDAYSITLKRYEGRAPGLSAINSFLRLFG